MNETCTDRSVRWFSAQSSCQTGRALLPPSVSQLPLLRCYSRTNCKSPTIPHHQMSTASQSSLRDSFWCCLTPANTY
ncbi:hypothetical protein NP493_2208g00001 [Ridgeia piscesae]|uniref:Uncharacterized protein n=1 Tax=Ridgeia piscesae TaxID=27915 RepID=A0AAD9JKA3_RIDPI|nr:hypothetical protein NP493_2208g00001 [Ridgeia piscesae]